MSEKPDERPEWAQTVAAHLDNPLVREELAKHQRQLDEPGTSRGIAQWGPPPSRLEWPPETEPDTTYRFTYKSGPAHVERHTDPLAALEALIDVPPLTAPQAQGDVLVLPWPPTTAPAMRAERADAATLIPPEGCPIEPTRSHILLPVDLPPDGHGPRPRYIQLDKGNTLGVLVVEEGAAARLSHREHPDLLIGPGVYALHTQRRWTHRGAPARIVD